MLKGHVFSKQLFEHPIFALFINTFLNGANGVSDNYKNGMALTYSGSNVTVDSGAVIIQGRPVEEDTSTTISAGTENMYCKLVVEIDLDKQNTESELNQVSYKILKSANSYPTLIQNNIVKNNAGVYQYELARFRTSVNGISEFQDKRTFLDFDSIYSKIETEYRAVLEQLREELKDVEDGSAYVINGTQVETFSAEGISGRIIKQGKIAVVKFIIDGTADELTTIDISSVPFRPVGSFEQSFVIMEATSSSEILGPVSLCISESGQDGVKLNFRKNVSLDKLYEVISGVMTYICQ